MMRSSVSLVVAVAAAAASAQTLASLCTTSHVQQSLPANGAVDGIYFYTNRTTANAVYNLTVQESSSGPGASGLAYCNVTLAYYHPGQAETYQLQYYLPQPSGFKNRFLATGGGGESINSGSAALEYGPVYGAVAGLTDGGFGGFNVELTSVLITANGSLNYNHLYAFAYKAIHEMSVIGKDLTKNFYGVSKIYSYYTACSEGGREGWSQIQRYGTQFDGAVVGAPAFRQAFQQVNHLTSNVIEKTLGYAPPPCELAKINSDLIAACDPLDGKTDGVVARTDLCRLRYNLNASLGKSYSCASGSGGTGFGGPSTGTGTGTGIGTGAPGGGGAPGGSSGGSSAPAQNGTVSAMGIKVAQAILNGLYDSKGRQLYIPYQFSAPFTDGATTYNSTTGKYEVEASGIAISWITQFLQETTATTLSLDNVTVDTLRTWILEGYQKYQSTMQTVWTDLEEFHNNGGKVIHYHGESDDSVPSDSSVIYQDAVRTTMYPGMDFASSHQALGEWYRLFLIPGGAHCMPSSLQPNAPWPVTMVLALFDWVEKGVTPVTLNGTILSGTEKGSSQKLCAWPLRPQWTGYNGTGEVQCVSASAAALKTWYPTLNSVPVPVYGDP